MNTSLGHMHSHCIWGMLCLSHLLFPCTLAVIAPTISVAEERTKDISFDDIKFDMKKGEPFERSMLTKEIEALVGTKIRIRGYMLPQFQQKGIEQFVFVRDNLECCFGPGAALFDCLMVEMQNGKTASFTVRPFAIEGVFRIEEFKDPDGKHLAIYHLDGLSIK
jgi:hypothetical protein